MFSNGMTMTCSKDYSVALGHVTFLTITFLMILLWSLVTRMLFLHQEVTL